MTELETPLQPGTRLLGFTVKKTTPVPALRGTAIELAHDICGARILHLLTSDTENLFSISVPTPPADDAGTPHILEHSVLAGSRRFPVREPFFEMLKSSMATFINAMTGPDCTYYPVSSNVRQDLFNLAEVYFDAVFHPLLTRETFEREGHHLAPAADTPPPGQLTVNGIVYNEMKGVFSNPESRLFYTWIRHLLPDTPYALNYAGDPDAIPGLTYEQFKRYYETHYHPSNALFYFYGDIPTTAYLEFLAPRLAGLERHPPLPAPSRQPRWSAPAHCHEHYPVAPGEPLDGKTFLVLTWLTGQALDPEQAVLRHVLTYALFGNEAAPLKKALVDSRLGHDLLECGDMDLGPESLFAVGLKGSEPGRREAFETLVLSTLGAIASQGLDREAIEAAFQQTAYHYLEIAPQFPLHTMNHVLEAWAHGADPLTFLDMNRHLENSKRRYADDPALFSRLIRDTLIDNPHRLSTVLSPDAGFQSRADARFAARMEAERKRRTDDEMRLLAEQAAAVEREAGTPNPPDKIALLPQLRTRDLPARPRAIPTTVTRLPLPASLATVHRPPSTGVPLLRNDVFSNGINYLQFSLDLDGLPDDLWPFLPCYSDAITKLGAAGMDYGAIARRVAASTGGISCSPVLHYHAGAPGRPVLGMRFACKALDNQIGKAMDLLRDLVFSVDPRDRTRLRDVLQQSRAGYRSDVLENGQSYAQGHAGRHLGRVAMLDEQCHGIPQVALTARLDDQFEQEAGAVMDHVERIRAFLLDPARLSISFTGSEAAYDAVSTAFRAWIAGMSKAGGRNTAEGGGKTAGYETSPAALSIREGLAVPVQVAHCAQAMRAPTLDHPASAALVIGAHLVRFDYFLSEIRLKGNAYGAGFSYNPVSGTLFMTSFRDPHVVRTLEVFAGTRDFVSQASWTQADVDRAIIGAAKGDVRPLRPGEVTGEALSRHLQGKTDELLEAFYHSRLAVTPAATRQALLETLDAGRASSPVCVLSSREKLEEANAALGDSALAISDVVM